MSSPWVKVSVVVAVYNPGTDLDALVTSLVAQTMAAAEFEVIFVDDGSTDGSGARLDALVVDHPTFHVIHIPNSGWPGRPRNVGIDAATGTYVYIVDHDDWLGDEALERLYARAERNEADVVVGREVGHGFGVPRQLFRRNVDDATLEKSHLLALLTPHKLFRRSMLTEHRIRFPEGRRRLEDHVFVMQAYFHARRISILADYPCYHWVLRGDRSNATHRRVDPEGYYQNVREILDIVDRHTEPGTERNRLYAHWYRNKTLYKLRGRRWVDPDAHARALFREIRLIAEERFGPAVEQHIGARFRIISRALRADRLDLVASQAIFDLDVKAEVGPLAVESADWKLDLALSCRLTHPDGTPFTFAVRDGRTFWVPPAPLADDPDLRPEDLDVTDEIGRSTVTVVLRHRTTALEHDQVIKFTDHRTDSGVITMEGSVHATIDLSTIAAGGRLGPGIWDIRVHVASCGWSAQRRLAGIGSKQPLGPGVTEAYVTESGHLSIRVKGAALPPRPTPSRPAMPPLPRPARASITASSAARTMLRRVVPAPARRIARDALHAVSSLRRR